MMQQERIAGEQGLQHILLWKQRATPTSQRGLVFPGHRNAHAPRALGEVLLAAYFRRWTSGVPVAVFAEAFYPDTPWCLVAALGLVVAERFERAGIAETRLGSLGAKPSLPLSACTSHGLQSGQDGLGGPRAI